MNSKQRRALLACWPSVRRAWWVEYRVANASGHYDETACRRLADRAAERAAQQARDRETRAMGWTLPSGD